MFVLPIDVARTLTLQWTITSWTDCTLGEVPLINICYGGDDIQHENVKSGGVWGPPSADGGSGGLKV